MVVAIQWGVSPAVRAPIVFFLIYRHRELHSGIEIGFQSISFRILCVGFPFHCYGEEYKPKSSFNRHVYLSYLEVEHCSQVPNSFAFPIHPSFGTLIHPSSRLQRKWESTVNVNKSSQKCNFLALVWTQNCGYLSGEREGRRKRKAERGKFHMVKVLGTKF